jgi:DNA-directed RNA polymerase subunit RPC12/RpoP
MPVRYLCDSCGHRGVDRQAQSTDEVLCEVCGEPVLDDPDRPEIAESTDSAALQVTLRCGRG